MTIRPHTFLEETITPPLREASSPENRAKKIQRHSLEESSLRAQDIEQQGLEKISLLTEVDRSHSSIESKRVSYSSLITQESIDHASSSLRPISVEGPLDSIMIEPKLPLQQVYAISKEVWMQAIEMYPTQPFLYCHLARRLSVGETVYLKESQPLTAKEVFLEALKLDPENPSICYYFAEKMHDLYLYRKEWDPSFREYRSGASYISTAKEFYQKALLYDPLYFAAYIKVAELLLPNETFGLSNQVHLTSEQLCLKVIHQDPLYGDSYRCLADLSIKNPEHLKLIPDSTHQKLYLKAIQLEPDSPKGYISLYQAWDLVQEPGKREETLTLLSGECLKKEDLIFKAVALCSEDSSLKRLFESSFLLNDTCFFPFLEKLSLSSLSSQLKLKIYQFLLTRLLCKGEVSDICQTFQKLVIGIQKESAMIEHVLDEEAMIDQAETLYKKILSLGKAPNGSFFSDEEWHIGVKYYTFGEDLLQKKELYPYLAKIFLTRNYLASNAIKPIISLLTQAICFQPYNFRSYALLADCLATHHHVLFTAPASYECRNKLRVLLYLKSIEINPSHFAAYYGLYELCPSQGSILSQDYGITLIDPAPLSESALFVKTTELMPLTFHSLSLWQKTSHALTTLRQFIGIAFERISKSGFLQQLAQAIEKGHFPPEKICCIFQAFLHRELLYIFYSDAHKLRGHYTPWSLPYLKEGCQKLRQLNSNLLSHDEDPATYPDSQMINPQSSLEELTVIAFDIWEEVLKKNPSNTYFYCNLAKAFIKQSFLENPFEGKENLFQLQTDYYFQPLSNGERHKGEYFIISLYFRALAQDPFNMYAYRHLIEYLQMRDHPYPSFIEKTIESLYLFVMDFDPEDADNILAFTRFPLNETINPPVSLTKDQLFTTALARDLFYQIRDGNCPGFAVMKDGVIEDQSTVYLDILHNSHMHKEHLSYEKVEEKMHDIIAKMRALFPESTLYFKLASVNYPYLQYDSQQSEFCVSFYEIDDLSGLFQRITNSANHFNLQKILNFFSLKSRVIPIILMGVELIERSTFSREAKLELYRLLYMSDNRLCFSEVFAHAFEEDKEEDFFDYDGTFLNEWLSNKIGSKLRMGESINVYKDQTHDFRFASQKELHDMQTIDDKRTITDIQQQILEAEGMEIISLYIDLAERLSQNQRVEAPWGMGQNILVTKKEIYRAALQLYINDYACHGCFREKISLKAILYTRIADLLEDNESLHILLEEEVQDSLGMFYVKIRAPLHSPLPPLKTLTKQDLYLEALLIDPFLNEAFLGLENLSLESYHLQTNGFISKEELHSQLIEFIRDYEFLDESQKKFCILEQEEGEIDDYLLFKKEYQEGKNIDRSNQITQYTLSSLNTLYLHLIERSSYSPYPYYFLAERMTEQESIQLLNQVWLTKKELYQRSVQLMIQEPSAYYRLAYRLSPKQGVALFDKKTILAKLDLLAMAFILKPDCVFYLTELVKHVQSLHMVNQDK